jgi:hypothetical protein
MCQEELFANTQIMGVIHHRFIVFNGMAWGFEKRSCLPYLGPGGVRDERAQPTHRHVECYQLTCLLEECARTVLKNAIYAAQGQTYQLGYRDCQSWANNYERSAYNSCKDPCCPNDRGRRRHTWKTTGWDEVSLESPPPTESISVDPGTGYNISPILF